MTKEQLTENAIEFVKSYCNITAIPKSLEFIIPKMVEEDYNRQGSEGINSRGVSGISESYATDYSPAIYTILDRYKRIRVV